MNYEPVTAGNQTNRNAGIKDNVDAVPTQQYILLQLLSDSPQSLEDAISDDAGKKTIEEPANEGERNGQEKEGGTSNKEGDQNVRDLRAELDKLLVQQKEGYVNSTNRVSTVSPSVSVVGQTFVNVDDLSTDPLMLDLEDTTDLLNTGIFSGAYDDEDVGAEADLNKLETTMNVSPIPTTRIHTDHLKDQIIRDINSATQTRRMTKISEEHDMVEAMQEELLQFRLQKVWTLVDLPNGKRAIGTKWVYLEKEDDEGIYGISDEFGVKTSSCKVNTARQDLVLLGVKPFNDTYETPKHTQKVFANMRRKGKSFSETVTPLFQSMLAIQAVEGEGSGQPSEPQPTPSLAPSSHEEQSGGPPEKVGDEAVHKELGDRVERAATTTAGLNAEQDSEAMRGTIAQTRSERVPTPSYDSPLLGGHIPGSDEGRPNINELMAICTNLSNRVLALETSRTAQDLVIRKLKKKVRRLEKKLRARTPGMKLFKIGTSRRKSLDKENVSKQGRNLKTRPIFEEGYFNDDITDMVNKAMENVEGDTVNAGGAINTATTGVSAASASVITAGVSIYEDLIIAQTLMKMRSEKSKEKAKERGSKEKSSEPATRPTRGVTMQEPSESGTRKAVPPSQHDLKDKGKAKMIEPEKPLKKKDQIKFDEEVAKRLAEELEAELEEEERVTIQREEEANLIS
ncbi:hypothetical protein Tco_0583809 [Tanacetum coccineum]